MISGKSCILDGASWNVVKLDTNVNQSVLSFDDDEEGEEEEEDYHSRKGWVGRCPSF